MITIWPLYNFDPKRPLWRGSPITPAPIISVDHSQNVAIVYHAIPHVEINHKSSPIVWGLSRSW